MRARATFTVKEILALIDEATINGGDDHYESCIYEMGGEAMRNRIKEKILEREENTEA